METAGAQAPQAPHPAVRMAAFRFVSSIVYTNMPQPIDLTTESDGERPFQAPIVRAVCPSMRWVLIMLTCHS